MTTYVEFLSRKQAIPIKPGREVTTSDVHVHLHPWQREIVAWSVKTGRAAVWADTGLGKTLMQIEWARLSADRGVALIVAPLAVCQQTVREAAKIGVTARYVRSQSEITGPGLWVTNYEMVPQFTPDLIDAVVLDESSILKQSDGKTRTMLIDTFRDVPRKLACSATPAPGELVLTPFAGIGSELYQAVKRGRRAVGVELKESYWRTAVGNLTRLESSLSEPSLFEVAV